LRSAFPRLCFLRIVRRHKLRQALSTARALQTGLWKVQKGKSILREPEFDPDLIEQSLHEAERQEKIWDDFFRRIGIKPFKVEYEKLCQDYERTIRAVLNFLKIKLPAGARVGPPARPGKPMRFRACGRALHSERPSHTRQLLAKASHVESKRKNRAHQCSRGSIAIISRLLDVGHHFSRAAGCARRTQASQRRILYAMHDLSLFPGRQHRKCAKICGDTSGNYHPHGKRDLPHARAHGAAVGDARTAGRWPGEFRSSRAIRRQRCVTPKRA
jgi:Type IIA topoisomerase (DNA gyrase/topo II, topoisomerase IV), A subunit